MSDLRWGSAGASATNGWGEGATDLERCLLTRLCSVADIATIWGAGLKPEHLVEPLTQSVFAWAIDYWIDNRMMAAPTPVVLANEFNGLILPTVEESARAGSTSWLATELKRRHTRNQVYEIVRAAATTALEDPEGTLAAMVSSATTLGESTVVRNTEVNMADTIDERRRHYARRREHPSGLGATFGLDALDRHTGGLLPGELAVVGATAKTGKTFLLLNAAVHALCHGWRPIVYTLELSLLDIQERVDAIFSEVSYDRLSKSRLSDKEHKRLESAQEKLRKLGGLTVSRPVPGERTVAQLCARARQAEANYLIIDPLSFMDAGIKTQSLKEHHAHIVRTLKDEINRPGLEVPCVLAAHLRRGEPEITLESFANAVEIEQTADILLGMSRNATERANHMMRLAILGARRSDTAQWLLSWNLTDATDIHVSREIRE